MWMPYIFVVLSFLYGYKFCFALAWRWALFLCRGMCNALSIMSYYVMLICTRYACSYREWCARCEASRVVIVCVKSSTVALAPEECWYDVIDWAHYYFSVDYNSKQYVLYHYAWRRVLLSGVQCAQCLVFMLMQLASDSRLTLSMSMNF